MCQCAAPKCRRKIDSCPHEGPRRCRPAQTSPQRSLIGPSASARAAARWRGHTIRSARSVRARSHSARYVPASSVAQLPGTSGPNARRVVRRGTSTPACADNATAPDGSTSGASAAGDRSRRFARCHCQPGAPSMLLPQAQQIRRHLLDVRLDQFGIRHGFRVTDAPMRRGQKRSHIVNTDIGALSDRVERRRWRSQNRGTDGMSLCFLQINSLILVNSCCLAFRRRRLSFYSERSPS